MKKNCSLLIIVGNMYDLETDRLSFRFLSSQCVRPFRKEYFKSQHQLINMDSEQRNLDEVAIILNCPYPLGIFLLNPKIGIWNLCSRWNWSPVSLSHAVLDSFWYKGYPSLITNLDIWIRWRHFVAKRAGCNWHLHLDVFIWKRNPLPLLL